MTTLLHEYKPRGTCKQLIKAKEPEVLISGPAGTGKSRACLEKMNMMALKYPGMRGLIVRKTFASLRNSVLVTWKTYVVPQQLALGMINYKTATAQFIYNNGSVISLDGMDKASRILSSEYDVIYIQEATELSENDWEILATRLRNNQIPYQQIISDCNPDTPTHWLKVRCDKNLTKMFNAQHSDNPVLFDEDGIATKAGESYLSKLDKLTGVRFLRFRKGIWAAAEGLIFDEFDPSVHIVDRFEIPSTWRRYWTIDFGYNHPFVCQFWAEDPDGILYLYREIVMTNRTVDVHGLNILEQVTDKDGKWTEPKPTNIICDHDIGERKILEKTLGLKTVPAQKDVSHGIQASQKRLRVKENGKAGLYILRDSLVERDINLSDNKKPTCLQEEIVGYIWEIGADGQKKEKPRKEEDDCCDTMRYMVAHLDLKPRRNYARAGYY